MKPKIIVFASGSKTGGGSGFENLVIQSRNNSDLNFEIVAVVSNHEHGGVRERAERLGIPFVYFPGPFEAGEYQKIIRASGAQWVSLSGWLKLVLGLDPSKTFNIHPGPLPRFGGKGMYGIHVHEAVLEAFRKGELAHTEVTMHFVTPVYDEGPVFFRYPVPIEPDDTLESLARRINAVERQWQPKTTSLVVNGEIAWDGMNSHSLSVPQKYSFLDTAL
ncbi:phosphoribosylglycinamide formyltransferase [Patescibacteria group bacterium]|nr:MAG: phosphoribosylglycinamide formyltransferase [Patescibacteria group bacterium]